MWDRAILSESISTSVFVLLLASWIWMGARITGWRVGTMLAIAAFWSFCRESNSLLLLAPGAVLLLWAVIWCRGRRLERLQCLVAVGLLVAFVAGTTLISRRG